MGKRSKKRNFFTCRSCHKEQNLDQSIHIDIPYCVSCYNKEQVWREIMEDFQAFEYDLQESGKYTKIRRKKIQMLKNFSEMLLPLTIFDQSLGEIEDSLRELQRNAFKFGILSLQEKYNFSINENAITHELVEKLRPIFEYKRYPSDVKESIYTELSPFIDNPIKNLTQFFKDIKRRSTIAAFTQKKEGFQIIRKSPFTFNDSYLIRTVSAYVKRINKASSQPECFNRFIRYIGQDSQFQTMNDLLLESIIKYVRDFYPSKEQRFNERIMREINQEEESHLIPNIAKYIMDNHEYVFETWFTKILPFDKSRFMVSQAKTGSRTDFVVRLQYTFRSYELRVIENTLRDTTELMLRGKAQRKIEKFERDDSLSEEKKKSKINREKKRLKSRLESESLKEYEEKAAASFQMVARYLLINSEKAFNIILDKVVQYHYKRLKITTPVKYITNVLESGATEKRNNLKAFYLIQSREW